MGSVVLGIDRFLSEGLYRSLREHRIAVLSNQSAVTSRITYSVNELKSRGLDVEFVLVPEHGYWGLGDPGEVFEDAYDSVLGLPTRSIYGREEGFRALSEVDAVVIDIQDLGVRFYTYVTAVLQTLEYASRYGVSRVVVLDRPNPLGCSTTEGPILRSSYRSYVGYSELPVRYGLTIGELSLYYNAEKSLGLDVSVVAMLNYSRSLDIGDLGLPWVPPSPAIPDKETVFTYPSLALLEGTNVSEGRGTYTPFKVLGAPFIHPEELSRRLNSLNIPGVVFRPAYFKPKFSKYSGSTCGGVFVHVVERKRLRVTKLGLSVLRALYELYPEHLTFTKTDGRFYVDLLLGSHDWWNAVTGGEVDEFVSAADEESERFKESVKNYALYK
ncbi:MAG: DUF1343 domain-containing protein [Sulfolobales archaeon]